MIMGYTESTNVKDGVTVPPKELEAVPKVQTLDPTVDHGSMPEKNDNKNRKRSFLLYFSNVELGNEDGKRKAFSFLENGNKCCMAICFSNFEVGPKMKG
ncbi:hypothetical protein J1N35_003986 [Gossypium stocksii]|uniref:Uncharacterized protein n=1 Tax=Gossypium stocksii TaxID=47602 RepID=A0A9D3WBD6_9ROSI|nr:hypothetical protein J1N35_003986 [Gossypium stocksii]